MVSQHLWLFLFYIYILVLTNVSGLHAPSFNLLRCHETTRYSASEQPGLLLHAASGDGDVPNNCQITIVSSVWAVVATAMKMPVPSPAGMQSMYCANVLIDYMQQGECHEGTGSEVKAAVVDVSSR